MIHNTILSTIGETPIIRLQRVKVDNSSEILVKDEALNPGGSIKDRTAAFIIEQAERSGRLKPNSTIIESTSGNLGKALALVGAVKGYKIILVVDPNTPKSVIDFTTALGAQLEMVSESDEYGGYQRARLARIEQLLRENPNVFWTNQYENPDNPRAHATYTAREILADVDDFNCLVATVSTGGHLTGLSATLKEHIPDLTTVGVDAAGSAAFGFPYCGYIMRGLGLAWKPGNLDDRMVDEVQLVADYEGIATSQVLARHEGLLVGQSAGAAVFAALHYAHRHPGQRIVVIAPDSGANYLSESFDDAWLQLHGLANLIETAGLTGLEGLVEGARLPSHSIIRLRD